MSRTTKNAPEFSLAFTPFCIDRQAKEWNANYGVHMYLYRVEEAERLRDGSIRTQKYDLWAAEPDAYTIARDHFGNIQHEYETTRSGRKPLHVTIWRVDGQGRTYDNQTADGF
jgi:hypothetical protein